MNSEQRLNSVADRYRSLGFKVVVRPGPEELPPFAKDFKVEILATGPGGNVLASAKASPPELEADPNVPRYASHGGGGVWRQLSAIHRTHSHGQQNGCGHP